MSQMRTHFLEGRKREEWVGELGNVAHHKQGLTPWREGRRRSRLVSLKHGTSQARTHQLEEREQRSRLMSLKIGTSQTRTHFLEGMKREEQAGELGNMAHHKQGLTCWSGGRGRSRLVSLETWHVTNEDSLTGGEEEGGAGW